MSIKINGVIYEDGLVTMQMVGLNILWFYGGQICTTVQKLKKADQFGIMVRVSLKMFSKPLDFIVIYVIIAHGKKMGLKQKL